MASASRSRIGQIAGRELLPAERGRNGMVLIVADHRRKWWHRGERSGADFNPWNIQACSFLRKSAP